MKVSSAVLPFLILAAALGPPACGAQRGGTLSLNHEPRLAIQDWDQSLINQGGVHRPGDCCFSYTPRNIRCENMKHYFLTTSGCSQPAVIFITKRGQEVCAHPSADGVQACVKKLASANTKKELR